MCLAHEIACLFFTLSRLMPNVKLVSYEYQLLNLSVTLNI